MCQSGGCPAIRDDRRQGLEVGISPDQVLLTQIRERPQETSLRRIWVAVQGGRQVFHGRGIVQSCEGPPACLVLADWKWIAGPEPAPQCQSRADERRAGPDDQPAMKAQPAPGAVANSQLRIEKLPQFCHRLRSEG